MMIKQLLTCLLFLSFLVVGCDGKDNDDAAPAITITKDQVTGTWMEQGYRFDYFDAKNNKLHTESHDNRLVDRIEVSDAHLTWHYTEVGNAPIAVKYHLANEKGKNYIILTGSDNKSDKVEITALSHTSMVWVSRGPSVSLTVNGTTKTASYTTTTITFSK